MVNSAIDKAVEKKPSLLFVDDEPSLLTALRMAFRAGYHVTVTTDAYEAIELLKTRKFHVIVSDQRMPSMTGVELLAKAKELAPETIRVLLTGYSDNDAIIEAINGVEVHRFLKKPWDNAMLRKTINEAIELAYRLSGEAAQDGVSPLPATGENEPRKSAEIIPMPVHHRNTAEEKNATVQSQEKPTVLVVESMSVKSDLFDQVKSSLGDKADVIHARTVADVFNSMKRIPISTMVCTIDTQSEADRLFIQMLKKDYPYIFVIAVCDSTDSNHLIELINQAKIFRFIRTPVKTTVLLHYILSAIEQFEELRKNPLLIHAQHTEEISESLLTSTVGKSFLDQFANANKSIASSFAKLFGFFRSN